MRKGREKPKGYEGAGRCPECGEGLVWVRAGTRGAEVVCPTCLAEGRRRWEMIVKGREGR